MYTLCKLQQLQITIEHSFQFHSEKTVYSQQIWYFILPIFTDYFIVHRRYTKTIFFTISDTRQDEDEQSGSRGDRITTTSLIKFRPTSADDDITWACEAEPPALLNPPLRTAVLLSVQRKYLINLHFVNADRFIP